MPVRKYNIAPIGKRFGHLTVLGFSHARPRRRIGQYFYWLCRCDCGVEKPVDAFSLNNGGTTSCGCYALHVRRTKGITHGMTHSPEYQTWSDMLARCGKPVHVNYPRYGGRGIKVCERWYTFENFYDDMGPRPSNNHSIDRIDNNGNYEPHNCRWATRKEQAANTRQNRLITYDGQTKPLAHWARETGQTFQSLDYRLRHGWPTEKALTVPPKRTGR